jgi:glycosyltransferase involved in cell wall biosynthesis
VNHDFSQEIKLPKIVIVYGGKGEAQRYRCVHFQQQLNLYGILCHVHEFQNVSFTLQSHDFVVFHRIPFDRYIKNLIKQIHRNGGIAVFDTDDFIFDTSILDWVRSLPGTDVIKTSLYKDDIRRYRQMLEHSDVARVSTDFLAQQVSSFGKPSWVHRNAFSLEMLSISEQAYKQREWNKSKIVIGYASGTPTHDRDFQEAKLALQQILQKYPQTELWIVGHLDSGNDWGALCDRVKRIPFVPWQQLPYLLAQFDINLAPLELNNPFCQAKSEVKYIEAGLVRVATIASKTEAFEYAIHPGDNGLLATTHEDWVESLQRLVEDATLRREMGERAYVDVLERYHPLARGRELIATLNQISQHVRGYPLWTAEETLRYLDIHTLPSLSSASPEERTPSVIRRAWYALRYRGMRTFLMSAWLYLKRQVYRRPAAR